MYCMMFCIMMNCFLAGVGVGHHFMCKTMSTVTHVLVLATIIWAAASLQTS